jgi:cell division protein FtsZ
MKKKISQSVKKITAVTEKKVKKPRKILIKSKIVKKPVMVIKEKKVKKEVVEKSTIKKTGRVIKTEKIIENSQKKKEKLTVKQNFVFSPEALFKAKIKVIGIGGGGGSIVSEIGRTLEKATFLIADTDIRALKKRNNIKHLWFGENLTHGLGTGVNIDLAKRAAEESKEKFKNIFEGQDIIIFIASLGGGLGSGATQVFIDAAREFGGITLGIFTLPFKFEGKNKSKIAQNALKSLRESLNVSLIIPNEKIFKVIDANTAITDAFSMVNKNLIGSLESLIDLIYNPGIINIDFADLKAILKGKGNQAFLNTIEESGKDRAEKICEKVFVNTLLQNHSFVADNILFNIVGSENLSMFEVEKISRKISDSNPKAKIIFGISKHPKLKNKIKTTILMTGSPSNKMEEKVVNPTENLVKMARAKEVIKKKNQIKVAKKEKKAVLKNKFKEEKAEQKFNEKIDLVSSLEVKEPISSTAISENKIKIIDAALSADLEKKTIRRSGLEVKKVQDQAEKKKLDQEKEWEIPAFLRRVKYKS